MSFILDAIAKSEAERRQREVPSAAVLAFPGDGPRPRRKPWPWLLAGAALVLNGLLLYLLLHDEPASVDAAPVTRSAPGPGPAPTGRVEPTLDAASAPLVRAPTRPGDTTTDTGAAIPPAATAPPSVALAVESTAAGTAGADDGEADWLRVEPDSLAREIDAAERAAGGPPAADDALFNRVVRPSELPANVRDDLPGVTFSGHLYSSNPRSSLVFVGDGRPVTTGQAIERDLVLHEITPDGVVVKFRGYLIEVGVLQNWKLD